MDFQKHVEEAKLELQIAPLIDVVFLLLIYFIMTTALIKKEGDISFMLPGKSSVSSDVIIPVEALIQITADGAVHLDGINFSPSDRNLSGLQSQLQRLKAMAESQRSPFFVNILPDQDSLHSRVIDVMDACAASDVEHLSFSKAL